MRGAGGQIGANSSSKGGGLNAIRLLDIAIPFYNHYLEGKKYQLSEKEGKMACRKTDQTHRTHREIKIVWQRNTASHEIEEPEGATTPLQRPSNT